MGFLFAQGVTITSGQGDVVWAFYDILKQYDHGSYTTLEDSVEYDDLLDGQFQFSFYIRPENPEVYNAMMTLTTPHSPDNFPYMSWAPDASYNWIPNGDNYYEWQFTSPIPSYEEAAVWLPTNFPVTFQPEYDLSRTVDHIMINPGVETQIVTIEFTPHTNFINAHIAVGVHETYEALPTVVVGSSTPSYILYEELDGVEWVIPVSDIVPGVKYTFSFTLTVVNKLTEPIYYKSRLGIGANIILKQEDLGYQETVTEGSILLGDPTTFTGTDIDGYNLHWMKFKQMEHCVSFPCVSSCLPSTLPSYEGTLDTWFSNGANEKIIESDWKVFLKKDAGNFEAEFTELNIWEDIPPEMIPPDVTGTYDFYKVEMKADLVSHIDNRYELRGTSTWLRNEELWGEFYTEIVINEEFLLQQFWMQIYDEYHNPIRWMMGSLVPS